MATHSSVLAWRIPGTGEPVRLPSMGSHRVGHDWSDLTAAAVIKNPPVNAGDIETWVQSPRSGRYPGKGNSNPLQYSCLENSMDRGAWWAMVHGVTKSWCNWACTHVCMCVCVSWIFKHFCTRRHKTFFNVNTGEGNGNPLQYSCLQNPVDRGAWRATVAKEVAKGLNTT